MNLHRESVIDQLSCNVSSIKPVRFNRVCIELLMACAVSLVLLGAAYGLRMDISQRLQEPLFITEMMLHLGLIVTASITAAAFAFPDRAFNRAAGACLFSIFIGYSAFSLCIALNIYPHIEEVPHGGTHGIACAGCLLSFAFIPALFGVWRVTKLATVRPLLSGFAALVAAAGTGSLGVRLVESEILPHGLFVWHIMPFLLLALAGIYIGKKIFTTL